MVIKYICGNCSVEQLCISHRRMGETPTKEFFSCTCKNCKFENVVMIFKQEQYKIVFPPDKPNQVHDK